MEPDYQVLALSTTPNDPSWSSISAAMTKISAPSAWDITTGSNTIKVCLIDTGIDITHPDLAANVDQTIGYNAITNVSTATAANDDNGHGSHCSGGWVCPPFFSDGLIPPSPPPHQCASPVRACIAGIVGWLPSLPPPEPHRACAGLACRHHRRRREQWRGGGWCQLECEAAAVQVPG